MSDVRRRCLVVLVIVVAMASSRSAEAKAIVVQRPDAADPLLVELFSRLCGELRMYGFEARVVEGPAGADPSDEAATGGVPFSEVLGGVTMTRESGRASARIWIAPSGQRKEIVRITIDVGDDDAPSLLAIRAADLLYLGLRDENSAPTEDLRGKKGTPATAFASGSPTTAPASVSGGFERWKLGAGAVALWDAGGLGLGWAPLIQASVRLSQRFSLEGGWIGPMVGHDFSSGGATARVREEMVSVAAALTLVTGGRLQFDVFQGVGGMHLSVHGEAPAPSVGQDAAALTAVSATGGRLGVRLGEHLGLTLALAAVFTIPRPVVDVLGTSSASSEPLVLSSAGFDYGF
jgi:hypothetical protein